MLKELTLPSTVYLVTGYSDLRKGIEGLAVVMQGNLSLDPFNKSLYLFCCRHRDRIKGLLWEGDGFLLLYKRLDNGAFNWPRPAAAAMEVTPEQYRMLMQGLAVVARHPITEMENPPRTM